MQDASAVLTSYQGALPGIDLAEVPYLAEVLRNPLQACSHVQYMMGSLCSLVSEDRYQNIPSDHI